MGIAPHPTRPHRGEVLKKNRHTVTGFPHILVKVSSIKIWVLRPLDVQHFTHHVSTRTHISSKPEIIYDLTAKDAKIYAKCAKRSFWSIKIGVFSIKILRRSPIYVSFYLINPLIVRAWACRKMVRFFGGLTHSVFCSTVPYCAKFCEVQCFLCA